MLHLIIGLLGDLLTLPFGLLATAIYLIYNPEENDFKNFDKNKETIILLHGSGFNHSQWIIYRFFLKKYNVFSFNYAGLFSNNGNDGIDDYAKDLVRYKIKQIKIKTGTNQFIIMGHSMGGLIASYYDQYIAAKDNITISKIITISSPWIGSPLVTTLYKNKSNTPKRYLQMSLDSEFLNLLRSGINKNNTYKKYHCIASDGDIVVPFKYGIIDNCTYTKYTYWGHYSIML